MADFNFAPVATQIKPPEPIRLADMVNMASAMQQYQQAQQVNPLALQQAQQQVEQSKIATQKAGMGLAGDRMKAISDSQISMINNPLIVQAEQNPDSVDKNALAELIKRNGYQTADALGIPKDQADNLIAPYLQIAEQNPAAVRGYFKERHLQGLDAGARTPAMTPTMREVTGFAPTGEKVTQQVNVNPFAGPIGAPIGGTTSFAGAGQNMQPTGRTDAQGNPTAWVQDVSTGKVREVTIPAGGMGAAGGSDLSKPIGAGSPGAAAGGPPPPIPAGEEYGKPKRLNPLEQAMVEKSNQIFTDAGNAATQSPTLINNSNKIIELADKTTTGRGAQAIAALGGQYAAIPWSTDEANNLTQLGHYMAQQTTALASSAGLGTDASRALAGQIAGTTEWTAPAIKATARVNRALSTGQAMLYDGMRNYASQHRDDPNAAMTFRDTWAKTLGTSGIDALRLYDAYSNARDDHQGLAEIVKDLNGPDSARFRAARKKLNEIESLLR